jgi:hypothetical protein
MDQDELLKRQQELLARSAQLRFALAEQTQVLKKPLAVADRARDLVGWLANHPAWPMTAFVVLFAMRPRRVLLWGGRLWWIYRSYHQARSWINNPR